MYFRLYRLRHKPRLLNVADQLKRSAHAALGLAIKCAQNTSCRPTDAGDYLLGAWSNLPGGNIGSESVVSNCVVGLTGEGLMCVQSKRLRSMDRGYINS